MKKLFNFRPVLFGALSIAAGIFFSVLSAYIGVWSIVVPIIVIAALSVLFFGIFKSFSFIRYGIIFTVLFVVGFALLIGKVTFSASADGQYFETDFVGTVSSVGQINNSDKHYVILTDVKGENVNFNNTNVYLVTDTEGLKRGDEVKGNSVFVKNALNFDDLYKLEKQIVFVDQAEVTNLIKTKESALSGEFVANKIIDAIYTFTPKDEAGVMVALLLGRSDGIDRDVLSRYRMAGIAHIFAVSGMHVGFFFYIFGFIFGLVGIKRWQNTVLSTIITLFYAIMCASFSAYRALIMCFIFGIAKSFGNKYDFLNSIFLSMIVILLLFPSGLFSVGFLLSYSAVISVALWSSQIARIFSFLPKKLASSFSTSLAVSAGTLPIVALSFGYASAITVFVNLLFMPIVPLVYVLSLIGGVLAVTFSYGNVFLIISSYVCNTINVILTHVDLEKYLLVFRGNLILYVLYSVIFVLTSEKINIPEKFRKGLYVLLPVAAFSLI